MWEFAIPKGKRCPACPDDLLCSFFLFITAVYVWLFCSYSGAECAGWLRLPAQRQRRTVSILFCNIRYCTPLSHTHTHTRAFTLLRPACHHSAGSFISIERHLQVLTSTTLKSPTATHTLPFAVSIKDICALKRRYTLNRDCDVWLASKTHKYTHNI